MTDLASQKALTRSTPNLPLSWYFDPKVAEIEQAVAHDIADAREALENDCDVSRAQRSARRSLGKRSVGRCKRSPIARGRRASSDIC